MQETYSISFKIHLKQKYINAVVKVRVMIVGHNQVLYQQLDNLMWRPRDGKL